MNQGLSADGKQWWSRAFISNLVPAPGVFGLSFHLCQRLNQRFKTKVIVPRFIKMRKASGLIMRTGVTTSVAVSAWVQRWSGGEGEGGRVEVDLVDTSR